jgi:hypothetical protein
LFPPSTDLLRHQCGTISIGVNVATKNEDKAKEISTMQHDELARLFSANMSLSEQQTVSQHEEHPQKQPPNSQPITYISQHYTHSSHIVPVRQTTTQFDTQELEAILVRNSIDPAQLFPSQVDLFRNADDDQRLRLLELWRISPPMGRQGAPTGMDYNMSRQLYDWPPTSLAQEEAMAKLRYEKQMEERAQTEEIQRHQEHLDESMAMSASGSMTLQVTVDTGNAEPYMASGYEMMARREYEESARAAEVQQKELEKYNHATDPVYSAQANDLWQPHVASLLEMENQYGAFAASRDQQGPHIYGECEMVM